MAKTICPGQDTRFWQPEDIFDIACGQCGHTIEFFKDEASRRCPGCSARVQNPKLSFGCAQWCEHAKECLGYDPKEMGNDAADDVALVDRLVEAVKREFGPDRKRITHALAVLDRARGILRREEANPRVVLVAALLHDIGIKEAERVHGSSAPAYQEMEGPPIAMRIMKELGLDGDTIDHVCRIVGSHHSARDIDTPEFRVIWDSDWLVNMPDEFPGVGRDRLAERIEWIFKTEAGRETARELFVIGRAAPADSC